MIWATDRGDVIRQINDTRITNVEEFKKAVIKNRWKDSIVLLIQRDDRGYYITVKTPYNE